MVKKVKPYTKNWWKKAYKEALGYCPEIYQCKKCGNPVLKGYCCNFCGDTNPNHSIEEEEEEEEKD